MSTENQLQHDLAKQASRMTPPADLKDRVRNSYELHLKEQKKERSPMKKKLLTAVAAVCLLVPSVGFAADSGMLGDDIYGSFQQAKKSFKSFTKETYAGFALKLSGAKRELGEEEYAKFVAIRKQYIGFLSEHGDKYGHIDVDKLSAEDRATLKQLMASMTPDDDKLNHNKSTRDVLTAEEYDQYLEAQLTYQTVMARTGVEYDREIDVEKLPDDLKDRYVSANDLIESVNEKIHLPNEYEQKEIDTIGEADYQKYRDIQNQLNHLRRQYQPNNMLLNYNQLPAEARAQAKELLKQEQPYLERIRHQKLQSQDVLTPQEQDAYLEALITFDSIQANHYVLKNKAYRFDESAVTGDEKKQYDQALAVINQVSERLK
ncbi:DUF3600 domain-containing protein [Tumebacillus sp. ITR2]|uniref:DUF3600 domain-containing protein n=1 Tax=Tumebacillus amylolyticus TaxID=2801339 RepID=A0ABS1J901_9BACL|nr:DUF3600 domain-containing protein [Tumebacillus amylolyticus]MBL0386763.1 DUF3600 domain-containing protein [Tumebacillus amylolyticus]